MRDIRFRAWNGKDKLMGEPFTIGDFVSAIHESDNIDTEGIVYLQCTGLKDKNGKEIYEGDILNESGYHFSVVWDDRYAKFKLKHDKKTVQYPEWNRGENMIIIGNIYQNPELL